MPVTNEGDGVVAEASYKRGNYIDPASFGFTEVDSMGNDMTGFHAQSYKRGDDIIISYRVSDNKPQECEDALTYYEYMRKRYPEANISLTGHSLDGAMIKYAI